MIQFLGGWRLSSEETYRSGHHAGGSPETRLAARLRNSVPQSDLADGTGVLAQNSAQSFIMARRFSNRSPRR